MQQLLLVFIGGGLGSLCRFGFSRLIPSSSIFYYGTFAANVIGSLILGIIVGLSLKNIAGTDTRLFFITGFCGGFSTFSTFSHETLQLFQSGNYLAAFNYMFWSILVCVCCIYLGIRMTSL